MRRAVLAVTLALGALASPSARAAPWFEEQTTRLGSPQPCFDPSTPNAEGCYSHYTVLVDMNGDRSLDLVFANGGGHLAPGTDAPLAFYSNEGDGTFREIGTTALGGVRARAFQVAVGDVDGDGDLDLYVPDSFGLALDHLFLNDGRTKPTFFDDAARRLPVSSHAGAARFGDLDGDGDLDLVVGDWGSHPPSSPGTARVYLNDGRGYFAEKPGAVPDEAHSVASGPVDADLFDADGDFDLDLVLANRLGSSLFFRNDGSGGFVRDPTFPAQPGGYVYGPDECDIDGDGDLDMWLDNGAESHNEQLLVNDGRGHFTDETAARVSGNPSLVDDNVVRCADVDGDGALDAVVGSVSGDRRVLLNDGSGRFALLAEAFPAQTISTLGLDVGDVTGDGVLDVVTAQGESGSFLNRLYVGTRLNKDVLAPVVRTLEHLPDGTAQGTAVVRFAVRDGATTDVGPRLRAATVETDDGVFPAMFVGGDLFRAVVPVPSTRVTYRACAEDWAKNRGCSATVTFLPRGGSERGSLVAGGGCMMHVSGSRASCAAAALAVALLLLAQRRRR